MRYDTPYEPDEIRRNPILGLPAVAKLRSELGPAGRRAMAELLTELGRDCGDRADASWRANKAPMAAYWKTCGVYARHISRALRRGLT